MAASTNKNVIFAALAGNSAIAVTKFIAAFITGSADSPTGMERLAGYREALSRQDIPVQEALIAPGKWTPACGAAAVSTLLARGVSFTALIASNDDMAIGAIKQLHECGVSVP